MINKFLASLAIAGIVVSGVPQEARAEHLWEGDSFYGGWDIPNMRSGSILLGSGDGSGLLLTGTSSYCVSRGSSYSTMNDFIDSNYNTGGVSWFVDEICTNGYVRICVYSNWGDISCSTYIEDGWVRFY